MADLYDSAPTQAPGGDAYGRAVARRPAPAADRPGAVPAGGDRPPLTLWSYLQQVLKQATGPTGSLTAAGQGLKRGAQDVLQGGAQIGVRMAQAPQIGQTAPEMPGRVGDIDRTVRRSAADYAASPAVQAHPGWAGAGRLGGNVAATAPLALPPGGAASIPGRLTAGGVAGAAGVAMQPVTQGDYWQEKAKQAAIGGTFGAGLGLAGRAIGPPLGRDAQNAIGKFPYIAGIVRGSARRTPENFQKAVVNQALEPLKLVAPPQVKAGDDLIAWGTGKLRDAYNRELAGTEVDIAGDKAFGDALNNTRDELKIAPADVQHQFNNFVERHLERKLQAGSGRLAEGDIKGVAHEFGAMGQNLSRHQDEWQRELGDALYQVRSHVMDAVARQNPEKAAALARIDQAYAMFARVGSAAYRRLGSEGQFTPADLIMVAKPRERHLGTFAKPDAAIRAMGMAAKGPMSAPAVNRTLAQALGGATGAGIGYHVGGPWGAAAGGYVGREAGPGIARGVSRAAQTPFARAVGRGVSGLAPAAGGTAAQRLKAQQKVSEIQRNLYAAKRRGDTTEAQTLMAQMQDADAEYRRLRSQETAYA